MVYARAVLKKQKCGKLKTERKPCTPNIASLQKGKEAQG